MKSIPSLSIAGTCFATCRGDPPGEEPDSDAAQVMRGLASMFL